MSINALIGHSPAMKQLRACVQRAARHEAAVLIQGPTGSGKELVAQALHQLSARREQPFVAINCGAIPADLLESELFGFKRGSFTGADHHHEGLLMSANGGTVLLDEVAELPMVMQVKLLRVIQEGRLRPLGSRQERCLNVRWLAATHRDLPRRLAAQQFRHDLYYRLAVLEIQVPGLDARRQDIALLAAHLRERTLAAAPTASAPLLGDAALMALQAHHYPGHVRQLDNHIQRGLAMAEGGFIQPEDLGLGAPGLRSNGLRQGLDIGPTRSLDQELADLERQRLIEVLRRHPNNDKAAAQALGLTPRALRYRLAKYDLSRHRLNNGGLDQPTQSSQPHGGGGASMG